MYIVPTLWEELRPDGINFDSYNINDGTTLVATIIRPNILPEIQTVWAARADWYEAYAGMTMGHGSLVLQIEFIGNFQTGRDNVQTWFGERRTTPKRLTGIDKNDADKEWITWAVPTTPVFVNKRVALISLDLTDDRWPFWTQKTATPIHWDILASPATKQFTPVGNSRSWPVVVVTPKAPKGGGGSNSYAKKYWRPIVNPINVPFQNLPYELCEDETGVSTFNTTALIGAGEMQGTGYDLRVFDENDNELDRWLGNFPGTATKIQINLSLSAPITLNLSGAMLAGDVISSITVKPTANAKTLLARLPNRYTFLIDDEPFTGQGVDLSNYKLLNVKRAQFLEAAAGHSDNAAINWVQRYVWIVHGNSTVGAPEIDDSKQPLIEPTSTNLVWTQNLFYDEAGLRTGGWRKGPIVSQSRLSDYYTGSHGDDANPGTEAGITILNKKVGTWRFEAHELYWQFYHPAGVRIVNVSGAKKKGWANTTWSPICGMWKSQTGVDGPSWTQIWNEAVPATTAWTNWAAHNDNIGTSPVYPYLKLRVKGNLNNRADNRIDFELQTATLTFITARVPYGHMRAKRDNYQLRARLTNQTSGESLVFNANGGINVPIVIDCEKEIIYRQADGLRIFPVTNSKFPGLVPGVLNTFAWTDDGTTDVDADFSYYGRHY